MELPSILWVAQYAPHRRRTSTFYVESDDVPESVVDGFAARSRPHVVVLAGGHRRQLGRALVRRGLSPGAG